MSPSGALLSLPPDVCEVWHGTMRTNAGQTIDFYVETPLTGDLQTTGLHPVDKTAAQRASALFQAWKLGRKAPAIITYRGPLTACGYQLGAVVTAVTVELPRQRRTGRITRMSSGRMQSGGCTEWTGQLKARSGQKVRFAVVSPSVAKVLRRARKRRAITTITYVDTAGTPCDPRLRVVVVQARSARARPRPSGR